MISVFFKVLWQSYNSFVLSEIQSKVHRCLLDATGTRQQRQKNSPKEDPINEQSGQGGPVTFVLARNIVFCCCCFRYKSFSCPFKKVPISSWPHSLPSCETCVRAMNCGWLTTGYEQRNSMVWELSQLSTLFSLPLSAVCWMTSEHWMTVREDKKDKVGSGRRVWGVDVFQFSIGRNVFFFFPESSASTLTWLHLIGHWGRALPCSSPEGGWIQPALPDLEVRARRAWWDPGAGRNRAYRCCCCSWAPHDSNEALRSPHVGWEQRPPYVDLANPVVWQGRCTLLLSSSGCRWDGCLHAPLFGWQGWGNAGDQSVGAAPPRRDPLIVPNPLLRRLHAET